MKLFITLTCCLVLCSSAAVAQMVQRDLLIDRIESHYLQQTTFFAESPLVNMLLGPAKSVNPNVSAETWLSIKKDIAPKLEKVMTEKGSVMDMVFRKSAENLSDEELDRLDKILSDPVYSKFQRAFGSASTQKQLLQGMAINALKFNAVVNDELTSHGLKGVH